MIILTILYKSFKFWKIQNQNLIKMIIIILKIFIVSIFININIILIIILTIIYLRQLKNGSY